MLLSFSWELQQVLESLGYTHLSESYHCLIQSSFASQLETYGLWEWAVFILMHIKDHRRYFKTSLSSFITRFKPFELPLGSIVESLFDAVQALIDTAIGSVFFVNFPILSYIILHYFIGHLQKMHSPSDFI